MLTTLVEDLRANMHLMIVHFPIALLFTGAALDWAGYWWRRPVVTRFGFYLLALGMLSAIAAALVGPEPDPDVPVALFAWHTLFALATVIVALALVAWRFAAADGLRGRAALGYLGGSLLLLGCVSATGYFGGLVMDPPAPMPSVFLVAPPLLPAKLLIALLVVVGVAVLALWLSIGRQISPVSFARWRGAVQTAARELGAMGTLRRAPDHVSTTVSSDADDGVYSVGRMGR